MKSIRFETSAAVAVGEVTVTVVERSELKGATFGRAAVLQARKEPYAVLVRGPLGELAFSPDGTERSYADVLRECGLPESSVS